MVCSFGAFASNAVVTLPKLDNISVSSLPNIVGEKASPNLVLMIIDGEGYFSYDDGNPDCLTIMYINGNNWHEGHSGNCN